MQTFSDFWPYYLREHSRPGTRRLHLIGTTGTAGFLCTSLALQRPLYVLFAALCGYTFAWVGHFFVEHNKPATFKYPLWSFAADWKMWALALTGRLQPEIERALQPELSRPAAPPAPPARG